MEGNISTAAMLGIVLIILAAVIGIGFMVFSISKGVTNEGTVNVQDSLGAVSSQVFLDYDQKVITGTQAVGSLKSFEGKAYAVLIGTKALNTGQKISSDRATGADGDVAHLITNVAGSGEGSTFINYNALLEVGTTPTTVQSGGTTTKGAGDKILRLENGTYYADNGFKTDTNGNIELDLSTGGLFKSGNAEYIPSSTKFQANILKDPSGANIGIVLRQI